MSKLAVFLNTLLHPSSGQWMFVFIAHSSDGGGHTLITLILKQVALNKLRSHSVSAAHNLQKPVTAKLSS
jgi:hypothetical protein